MKDVFLHFPAVMASMLIVFKSYAQKGDSIKLNAQAMVRTAKIISGRMDLKIQKATYIEVPSKKGYLEFLIEDFTDMEAILQ